MIVSFKNFILLTDQKILFMDGQDLSTILGAIVGVLVMMLIIGKILIDQINHSAEKEEINKEKERFKSEAQKEKNDVLGLATKNVSELREYFIISKYQAKYSYTAALFAAIIGFIFFAVSTWLIFKGNISGMQITTISGAIVEIIAGLFFWLYKNATKQMHIFYHSLLDTEKLLIAIQLVENMPEDKREEAYKSIIAKILEIIVNNSKP